MSFIVASVDKKEFYTSDWPFGAWTTIVPAILSCQPWRSASMATQMKPSPRGSMATKPPSARTSAVSHVRGLPSFWDLGFPRVARLQRNLPDDFQIVTLQPHDAAGVVGEEADFLQA